MRNGIARRRHSGGYCDHGNRTAMISAPVSTSLLFVLVLGFCRGQQNAHAACSGNNLKACNTDYVMFANTKRLPEGGEELRKHCGLVLGQLNCTEKIARPCLSGLPRGAVLLALKSASEYYEEVCTESSPLNQEYRKRVPCLNKAGDRLHERMNDLLVKLYAIKETVPDREKIYHACCVYYDFLPDTGSALQGLTGECSDPKVHQFFLEFMQTFLGESLDVACGPYRAGSEQCRQQQRVLPDDALRAKATNFLEPMVAIIRAFGSGSGK